jgi:hypothetical protein
MSLHYDPTVHEALPEPEGDFVPEAAGSAEVSGHVRGPLPENTSVQAVLSTLHEGLLGEEVVGEAAVDEAGFYRMTYPRPEAGAGAPGDVSLRVRVLAADGETVGESAPLLAPGEQARVDVRLAPAPSGPSEYAFFERQLSEGLSTGLAGLEGADETVVEEVAGWLDVDPARLALFKQARALSGETALPAPAFYALGRSGLGLAAEDLVELPVHELRTTLDEAVAAGIVDAAGLGEMEGLVERLARHAVQEVVRPGHEAEQPGLADVLAAADIPPATIERVLGRYQQRTGTTAEFWEDFAPADEAAEGVDEAMAREVRLAVRVGELVGADPPLLRRLHERRREGGWSEPPDLSRYDFDDWCDLVGEVTPPPETEGLDEAEAAAEEELQEWVEERASAILDALEGEFPGAFIRLRLAESDEMSEAGRRLLARAPAHDVANESIRLRVEDEPGLVEGLDESEAEDAIEEVEAVERLSRVTGHAEEVAVLVGTGLRSALDVASLPQRQFVAAYAEALGGRAQAARVHAQAQQTAAGAKVASLRLLQSMQRAPFVLGARPPAAAGAGAIKGLPDVRTLFQAAGGFCDCEHCGSVYSPAAYFVDLLRYLNVSTPDRVKHLKGRVASQSVARVLGALARFQPLDVLLGRRPDLADLPLSCENTLTALPYIDLVNEVLEAALTGGSAAFDTGKTPADVLRAVPQNLSRAAYDRLQQAVHPLTLPYHQPLALARAYLAHLGVTRLELMRALGKGEGLRAALVAESLGMSGEEFVRVALPPEELWRHFGFAAEQEAGLGFVQALERVPVLLDAAGITFQTLIDLVSTRFLNASNQLQLETPTPDCNPEVVRVAGLDAAHLSRLVRLIRLQRRLGWPVALLDRALVALGATDLDAPVLEKLAAARDLAALLDRPLAELLVLWAPLDAWGKDNPFDRIFATRAVAWRTQDERTFQLKPERTELLETGDSLDPVASALLAGFRITSEELALLREMFKRRGAEPRLDLAGLSAIHRAVVLARALQLRLPALDLLLRLAPPEADPFRPGDPASTRRFVDLVREVQASDFTPERLAYLFRHESEPRRDPGPVPAQVASLLASIRRGLADAFSETSRPAEVTDDTLRQKLALLLDPALLDPALEALDPRSAATPARRRDVFDRHLARIFPDPAAAAVRLLAPPEAGAARAVLEEKWKANVAFVLDHLLPQLRVRQLRGAVVQTLSDTLGLTIPATARLLDGVLRSRERKGEPLLGDFLALLGTGLTGAYYALPEPAGEPTVLRTDSELAFSWAGAPPAPGVPAKNFSARWVGRLLPRAKGAHTFYLHTDGAVRLSLQVDGSERVLIEQPAAARAVEHASQPVVLDPGQLYEIRLDYRNQGGPAALTLQMGTGPGAKQPVPTSSLFPLEGLASFAPVEHSYRRLHKAAMLLVGFGVTDTQLEWLTADPAFLDLDALPMEPVAGTAGVALFDRWRQLAALYALRRKLPRSNVDLFEVFRAAGAEEALERLVQATGWERDVVVKFLGPQGMNVDAAAGLRPPVDAALEPALLRLARAVEVQRRVGVAPETLYAWANSIPDPDAAAAVVQAVKARYDETRWLEVARALNDPLRMERRDALVAYLLPRLRGLGVRNRNQLFEYFLIDVDMNPCMLTSRVRQAIGTVQTFFQRCLMNLEPKVPPRVIDDNDWKWLKSYRVWEANRKVFLYPENWIEPELRDDKSPLFQALERSILQQEIKDENVEAAFADYLEGLDEIARLDVRGVFFEERETHRMARRQKPSALNIPEAPRSEWDHGTYHVFARTFAAPFVWYYRRLENGRQWTAWEKIDADVEGDHLVPVIFQRRMHLFWTSFREVSKPVPRMERSTKGSPPELGKDWEIHLAYSVYDRGRWSRKRMSAHGVRDIGSFITIKHVKGKLHTRIDGTESLSPSDYTLRATIVEAGGLPRLVLHLYCRADGATPGRAQLQPSQVQLIARFALNGCNGALVPERASFVRPPVMAVPPTRARSGRNRARAAVATPPRQSFSHPFRLGQGGALNAPSGYRVAGMGYAAQPGGGALLALPAADTRGLSVVLPGAPQMRTGVSVVPVTNPRHPEDRRLFPFFFQDRHRSYFVRPIYADWKRPAPAMAPVLGRRALPPPPPAARRGVRPSPKAAVRTLARRLGGRREDAEAVDETMLLSPEAQDAWEDAQGEAWHPDDAEALFRRKRKRKRAPAPRPAPGRQAPRRAAAPPPRPAARAVGRVQRAPAMQAGYHERKLQFLPFEHTDTCRLMSTLKARGVSGLLDFNTSRPGQGQDHFLDQQGLWKPRGKTWFEKHYRVGPLVYRRDLPHLDVAFEAESPYGAYNWELFFHAPLQVAVRLAKEGRHEEAQRWFHFIFDPTTDSSAPSPRRYWRFAPFHENDEYESSRELMNLLSYAGRDAGLVRQREQVRNQLSAWWEKPFSPHVIARLRIAAYQKAVVMKYIDNLVEWGDKLFRRDTLESIQEATQIYILAANILGPRPEKIPPIVSRPTLTFQKMRQELNLFSNFEVRLENLQVRRPFRINARPDVGGARAVLGMATQYFCTPPNPQLDKYWDTVADRLFKIRNCMNIQGIVRTLALFDPPIDPGLLVRAAAAGVDLGSVIASLNAPPPHYRFRFLVARAVRLAEEIRSFGAMTLQVLEKKDAEALADLRARNETVLLDAVRDVRKKQVRQVEEALAELSLQREHVDMQMQHLNAQLAQLMNPQETAQQASLTINKVMSGVAEGIDLAAKVAHALPEFQSGAAGGFSSPFVTLQLGGQMLGDIASAFSSSIEKVMAKNESEAEMAATQAEYQRRREEWQHELELLAKEKAQVEKRLAEVQLKLEITSAELRAHDLEVENARKVEAYLRDKYTNQQLYGWMLGQLSGVYFQAYKVAFDAAQQAERAFRFERGDPSSSFIEFSYWDSLKKGLFAGERLLLDLRRLEAAHVEGDRRALEVKRHISLRLDYPQALLELLATGRCQIAVTEALLDGDFPGHYFRRLKTVSLTAAGTLPPLSNVNCTLTLLENRIRTDGNASGSYAPSSDAEDARFLVNLAPVQAVATSTPSDDHGLFHLRFDDDRYLPFEGAGAISNWRIELKQADNAVDLSGLGDLVLTLSYTARGGGAALEAIARAEREKGLARGGIKPEVQHLVSLRRDLPEAWKKLEEAAAGQEVELPLPLGADRLSARLRGLDVRIERASVLAVARAALAPDALKVRLDPPKGSGATLTGWAPPWPQSHALRATAEVSGPPGTWKLAVGASGGKVPQLVDDLVLVFELRARKS